MQPNATELKVSPLLATPNEASVVTSRATLAQCVGVSGVPNEATVASFSASPLGVNGAKRAKLSHKIEISPLKRASVVPAHGANLASLPPAPPQRTPQTHATTAPYAVAPPRCTLRTYRWREGTSPRSRGRRLVSLSAAQHRDDSSLITDKEANDADDIA